MINSVKNTICLWYDGDAEEAARLYANTFPDPAVTAVCRAPGDFPSGKQGDVLTVWFTVLGVQCLGLNGGPAFKHSEAFHFRLQPLTKSKRIVIGTRSWVMVDRRALAVGVRTNGDCLGKSRQSRLRKRYRTPIPLPPSVRLMR